MVLLRVRHFSGEIQVVACGSDGHRLYSSTLIAITPDGRLKRATHISDRLGFQLDENRGIRYSEGG